MEVVQHLKCKNAFKTKINKPQIIVPIRKIDLWKGTNVYRSNLKNSHLPQFILKTHSPNEFI